jgi:hypothetical protein
VSRSFRPGPLLAFLAPVFLVAACGSGATEVTDPPPDPAAYPVVAVGQARSVLAAVDAALVRGVDAKDTSSTVDSRLLGPYRELALADARVAAERKAKVPAAATMDQLRLIVPTGKTWPRFFVAVGNTGTTSTPVLRVLNSPAPRSPYGLWAETVMLPGATLPETAAAATGSAALAPDADGLVATPKEVLSGFAGYLNGDTSSASSKLFEQSVYSDQLGQRLAGDRKTLKAVATVASTHTVGSAEPFAVRTADGGALVFGELRQKYTITIKKGKGAVDVTDKDLAALAGGKSKIKKSLTRTAAEIVVFSVPPSGKGLITVIAAQKGDVKAVIT